MRVTTMLAFAEAAIRDFLEFASDRDQESDEWYVIRPR